MTIDQTPQTNKKERMNVTTRRRFIAHTINKRPSNLTSNAPIEEKQEGGDHGDVLAEAEAMNIKS